MDYLLIFVPSPKCVLLISDRWPSSTYSVSCLLWSINRIKKTMTFTKCCALILQLLNWYGMAWHLSSGAVLFPKVRIGPLRGHPSKMSGQRGRGGVNQCGRPQTGRGRLSTERLQPEKKESDTPPCPPGSRAFGSQYILHLERFCDMVQTSLDGGGGVFQTNDGGHFLILILSQSFLILGHFKSFFLRRFWWMTP